MKVLIVGSGGREHALAWRLDREGVDVVVAPGNGGTPGAVGVQASSKSGTPTAPAATPRPAHSMNLRRLIGEPNCSGTSFMTPLTVRQA